MLLLLLLFLSTLHVVFLKYEYVRTSMLKACIFPKSLTKWGGIFKIMNCAIFSCICSHRYVNHVETNF